MAFLSWNPLRIRNGKNFGTRESFAQKLPRQTHHQTWLQKKFRSQWTTKLKYLGKLPHPRKQTWNLKMMGLKWISSSRGSFSGSMLVFWGVYFLNLNDQGIWGTFPLLFTTIWGWPEPGDPVGPVWSMKFAQVTGCRWWCNLSRLSQVSDVCGHKKPSRKTYENMKQPPQTVKFHTTSSFQPFLQKKNETPKNLITSSAVWHFLKRGGGGWYSHLWRWLPLLIRSLTRLLLAWALRLEMLLTWKRCDNFTRGSLRSSNNQGLLGGKLRLSCFFWNSSPVLLVEKYWQIGDPRLSCWSLKRKHIWCFFLVLLAIFAFPKPMTRYTLYEFQNNKHV